MAATPAPWPLAQAPAWFHPGPCLVVGDRWQRNLELEPSVCDEAIENRRRLNKMAKGGLHGAGLPFWTLLLVWSFRDWGCRRGRSTAGLGDQTPDSLGLVYLPRLTPSEIQ